MNADALAIFLMTRDPESVERERFGDVDVIKNLWMGKSHREMVKQHKLRAARYWAQRRGEVLVSEATGKLRASRKIGKMSPAQLAYVRSVVDKIREERETEHG